MRYVDLIHPKIIMEGGNVFKNSQKQPITRSINLFEIPQTIQWLESIVQLDLKNNLLGSVGKKSISGDLDIAVDPQYKTQLLDNLTKWVTLTQTTSSGDWIRKSGINIHFKTPIQGQIHNGFVQTDFMIGDTEWLKFRFWSPGDQSKFSGSDRAILIASIAKKHNLKFSNNGGLVSRTTNNIISQDPDNIAEILLGSGHNRNSLNSVETIVKALKANHTVEQLNELLHDCIENFRNVQGLDNKAELLNAIAGL